MIFDRLHVRMKGYLSRAILLLLCFGGVFSTFEKAPPNPAPPLAIVESSTNCTHNDGKVPCTFECIFTHSSPNINWTYTDESEVTTFVDASKYSVSILPKMREIIGNEGKHTGDPENDVQTLLFFNDTVPALGRYTCMSEDLSFKIPLSHTFQVSDQNVLLDYGPPACNSTSPCEELIPSQRPSYICVNNNTCQCAGYQNVYCFPPAGYGEFCIYDEQCQAVDINLYCSSYYRKCDCLYGYDYDTTEMACEYDYWSTYLSWSATVAIVVSIVLLLVIIVVFCMIYIRTSSSKQRRRQLGGSTRPEDRSGLSSNSECQMSNASDTPPAYEEIGMSRVRSETPPPSFDDILKSRDFLDLTPGVTAADLDEGATGGEVLRLECVTVTEDHLNPAYDGEC